jgi:hypothetical protein
MIHKKYNIEEIDDTERFSTNIKHKLYRKNIFKLHTDTIGAITIS